jgi:hypothetical protein
MPLKRATPSFTVEYRQAKRPNTGSAKLGWAHAKPAPAGGDEKANRIAISAFKTVAAHPPSDVISPSILPGRILPSIIETAPVTGQADAGGAQSKSHGSASKAAHATQVPGDVTVARHFGEHAYPAEDLEPSIAVAPIPRLKDPTTSDLSVEKVERQGRRNGAAVLHKSKRNSTTLLGRPRIGCGASVLRSRQAGAGKLRWITQREPHSKSWEPCCPWCPVYRV